MCRLKSGYYQNNQTENTVGYNGLRSKNISFRGSASSEKAVKNGVNEIHKLIEETAFAREPKTLDFVANYIQTKLSFKPQKNIVVGACSSGEEAMTINMLLNNCGEKVNILGFDLGKKAIEKAKSLRFIIRKPTEAWKEAHKNVIAYKDSYLAFNAKILSKTQQKYKKLFNDMFESADGHPPKKSFLGNLIYFIKEALEHPDMKNSDYKIFRVKPGKADNCKFVQGDIMALNKIVPRNSTDVLLFRNALYHLLSYGDSCGFERFPKNRTIARPIMEQVAKQAYQALGKDGIFVFGNNESKQSTDWKMVEEVLSSNGFKPIFEGKKGIHNVWQKMREPELKLKNS